MIRTSPSGLVLETGALTAPLYDLADINRAVAHLGLKVWPLDLSGRSERIRALLAKERPTPEEMQEIKAAFLLERAALLEIVREARGSEAVPGGGALSTRVENHGYDYPQVYLAEAGADYSRFDRYHRNTADDGTPVDEVGQLLAGGGFRVFQRGDAGEEALLSLSCPAPDRGWLFSYSGGRPHIGSMTEASSGSKLVVQVFGPPLWTMRYEA